MTTTQNLIDDIRLRINDVNKARLHDAVLLRVINRAIHKVVEDFGGIHQTRTANSVDGQMYYALDSDVKAVEQVWYDGVELQQMDYNKMYSDYVADTEDVTEGTPHTYSVRIYGAAGTKYLFLYPIPNTDDYVIRADLKLYYPEITSATSGSAINLPEEMIEAILNWATYYAYRETGINDKMQFWMQEAQATMIEARPTKKVYRHGTNFQL